MKNTGKILSMLIVVCILFTGCSCSSEDQSVSGGKAGSTAGQQETTTEHQNTTEETTVTESDTTTEPSTTTEKLEMTTEPPIATTESSTTTKKPDTTTEPTTTTKKPETTTVPVTTTAQGPNNSETTPYEAHGRLAVSGTKLVDQYGNPYQLKGTSTHGISWFPQYVSLDTFKYLRDSFGVNVVRIAMYTAEYNGYCSGGNKDELKALVKKGVDEATKLGLYVIIDWHILSDGNPHQNKFEAINFFKEMSATYKNQDNVIYEICNEPNGGTSWADIKSYANEVIPVIRANDKDAIIVVGTPTWSQDVDQASYDKIAGYNNIMYALHYYAATHKQWIRDKAQIAINNGLALFVTEFSICDASGNGALDINEANLWLDFLNKNGISFVGWNLSNKGESSALFQTWCNKTSEFEESELTEWAKWLRDAIK